MWFSGCSNDPEGEDPDCSAVASSNDGAGIQEFEYIYDEYSPVGAVEVIDGRNSESCNVQQSQQLHVTNISNSIAARAHLIPVCKDSQDIA